MSSFTSTLSSSLNDLTTYLSSLSPKPSPSLHCQICETICSHLSSLDSLIPPTPCNEDPTSDPVEAWEHLMIPYLNSINLPYESLPFKVTLNPTYNCLGLTATQKKILLRIPVKNMITPSLESQTSDKAYLKYLKTLESLHPTIQLTLILLYNLKNSSAPHNLYAHSLPKSYTTSCAWSSSVYKNVMSSIGYEEFMKALKPRIMLLRYYLTLNLPHSLSDFLWALSAILSRQNNIMISSCHSEIGLTPVWDMMNHAQLDKAVISYIEKGEEGFELVTEGKRDYEIGENVDMFYGDRGNSDLLVSSGFVIPVENFEGQKDDVKAWMRIWKEDGLGKMKVRSRLGAQ
ncbi:hypothetical protein TrLO_g14099 [Triparma laevis f. longispina]|uniref:SET domain-containing protein n=1 Tax=Triparma laevis f. longispina TaxID=1714387 RepID=A0A9W7ALV9_9STRA|nr:hypothetical protein TrLO_g14099 [Triparma laevis f. longispina]